MVFLGVQRAIRVLTRASDLGQLKAFSGSSGQAVNYGQGGLQLASLLYFVSWRLHSGFSMFSGNLSA